MTTEQRKLVSVVFADVVGSTAFGSDNDPEAVRSVMASYYERMKGIAELHGGTVEKFIGDAVMVVFGVPRLHDDDAERAVRAALTMRDAMADLNRELGVSLAARVGVNTGEAVSGGGRDAQFLVTGDAVNVAARLQQGADADEVVVGPLTESLTRAAIEYQPRGAVTAKGKTEAIPAFRAVRPKSAVPEQARGLPAMRAQLVGRQRELRLLLDTFDRVRTERRAHLFTLVGNAGIGKSRLVGEALARISSSAGARALRGRCLPYGAGITYWPLMEIVRDDAGIAADDDRHAALAKLEHRTALLLAADAPPVRARLAAMLGLVPVEEALAGVPAADVPREIAWGMREYLAAIAREPAVVVIDDLQWAEPAVFDIIDGLAERAEDAPLLLLCVARPQLLETHADWAAGRSNAATITLDALSPDETTTLISRLLDVDDLPADLRARIVERSEGNPLFCEEFLRMLIDEGRVVREDDRWRANARASEVRVPESIHALLAARLDALAEEERRTMQVASIVGERFGGSEIHALAPEIDLPRALAGLRRAGFVLEDRETRSADRYRFKHLLMRDVAYAGLPKAARADLHETFADTLERAVGDRREEYAEIIAHHAERAFGLSVEVRAPAGSIERRARRALADALALGERARRRGDLDSLQPQAATMRSALAALGARVSEAERLQAALLDASEHYLAARYRDALRAYEEIIPKALSAGDGHAAAQAHLGAASTLVWAASEPDEFDAMRRHTTEAERLFTEAGDPGGATEAGLVALEMLWGSGKTLELMERGQALRARAQAIGDQAREVRITARLAAAAAVQGEFALAQELVAATTSLAAQMGSRVPSWTHATRASLVRLSGDLDAALSLYGEIAAIARRDRDEQLLIASLRNTGEVLMELGRYPEGLAATDDAIARSIKTGERWSRTELLATRAMGLAEMGDGPGSDAALGEARALLRESDVFAVAYTARCIAQVHAVFERWDAAEKAFRDSLRHFGASDYARFLWSALAVLGYAEMLERAGRPGEAAARLAEAEAMLPPQSGERAARLARLRAKLTGVRET